MKTITEFLINNTVNNHADIRAGKPVKNVDDIQIGDYIVYHWRERIKGDGLAKVIGQVISLPEITKDMYCSVGVEYKVRLLNNDVWEYTYPDGVPKKFSIIFNPNFISDVTWATDEEIKIYKENKQ